MTMMIIVGNQLEWHVPRHGLRRENMYRLQLAGFKDVHEYLAIHPEPELWENSGLFKCLRNKSTQFFMYFRATRECEDKHLNKVKIYTY